MRPVGLERTLRRLEPSGWVAAARTFTTSLRTAGHEPGRLLVVGTPDHEPWHLTAHLDDTARYRGLPALRPVLARWHVPPGAPQHLAVGVDAVHRARRGTTVLVAAEADDDALLERLDDARRGGAVLLGLGAEGSALPELAHDWLPLPRAEGDALETASHVVTELAAGTDVRRRLRLPLPRR